MRAIRDAEEYHSQSGSANNEYQCLSLDYLRSQSSGLHAHFSVVCKVDDVLCYPATETLLKGKMPAYGALQTIQGQVIPVLPGFYEVWGFYTWRDVYSRQTQTAK